MEMLSHCIACSHRAWKGALILIWSQSNLSSETCWLGIKMAEFRLNSFSLERILQQSSSKSSLSHGKTKLILEWSTSTLHHLSKQSLTHHSLNWLTQRWSHLAQWLVCRYLTSLPMKLTWKPCLTILAPEETSSRTTLNVLETKKSHDLKECNKELREKWSILNRVD